MDALVLLSDEVRPEQHLGRAELGRADLSKVVVMGGGDSAQLSSAQLSSAQLRGDAAVKNDGDGGQH